MKAKVITNKHDTVFLWLLVIYFNFCSHRFV